MTILRLLLITSLFAVPLAAQDDGLARSGIADRDLSKLGKDVNAFFEALDQDQRSDQLQSLEKIGSALGKSAKKAKVDEPLKYMGDWDYVLETSKAPGRAVTGNYGKGFFRHVFADPWDQLERRVVVLMSVPATAKDGRPPVVVGLKPTLDVTGKDLEEQLQTQAEAIYGGLLETHIVLLPIGLESGSGRKVETGEIDGSWMSDSGMYVFFTAYRILLEQLPFDRSRVVLDGWGEAGLDALRLATSTPFFSGLVLRSSPVDSPEVLYANLEGVPTLYLQGADDAAPGDLAALTERDDVDLTVEVVDAGATALGASDEASAALGTWIADRKRALAPTDFSYQLGDVRFGSINWCTAAVINRRVTAQPGDADFPRLTAKVDKGSNAIDIETVNVLEMFVYLSDEVVDLDKPVTIRVNGEEKVKGKVFPRALRHLLETRFFNNSGDYGLYTASVRIEDIDANLPGS
jgi:hypothetical protein